MPLGMLTWGHGLHVSGELATHIVVVGLEVNEGASFWLSAS